MSSGDAAHASLTDRLLLPVTSPPRHALILPTETADISSATVASGYRRSGGGGGEVGWVGEGLNHVIAASDDDDLDASEVDERRHQWNTLQSRA